MAKDKVAAIFDIIKWDDDYTLEDFEIIHSHPSLEQSFLFHEDLLTYFLEMDEYWELKINHIYRIFIVVAVSPTYTNSYEYGTELDGWDWDLLVLTNEDLGEVRDDSSEQSE